MKDWLPSFAANSLNGVDRDRVRAHLADCPSCRADLVAWQVIADAAPPGSVVQTAGGRDEGVPDPARVVRAVLTRSAIEGPIIPSPKVTRRDACGTSPRWC